MRPSFFEKCTDLKQPYSKFTGAQNFHDIKRDTIVLLSYQVNQVFCCSKGLYHMKNYERYQYHISRADNCTGLMLLRIFSEAFMSISEKHNYKAFTKSHPASSLH